MNRKLVTLFAMFLALGLIACSKSPEERMEALKPKIADVMCDKMTTCLKPELDAMGAQARAMMPPMMQSKDSCVTFMKKEMEKKAGEETEEKPTAEDVAAAESCLAAFERADCATIKNSRGQLPGCEKMRR